MPFGPWPGLGGGTIVRPITVGGTLKFTGAIATGIDPVTSYLADPGVSAASAEASFQNQAAQTYPTGAAVFKHLRVIKGLMSGEGADQNITVSLVKNGIVTLLSVVVLAADAPGTQYADTTHVITASAGDTFDILATAGGTETPIVTGLTATLNTEPDIIPVGSLDARLFAQKRARELGVFTRVPTTFEDDFIAPPGTSPSKWLRPLVSDGTVIQLAEERGGVARISTPVTANKVESFNLGPATGPLPGLISDPGVSGSHWYLLWIFRVPTTVDNQTSLTFNLTPISGGANEIFFGVDGIFASTTKLMAEENIVNITTSTVDISPGTWHYLEAYQFGTANDIKFRFDGEAELTLTLTGSFGHAATAQMAVFNGTTAAIRSLDTDHVVILMDGNVSLP